MTDRETLVDLSFEVDPPDALVADRNEIKRFVETVFKHADGGTYVLLRAFADNEPWGGWRRVKLNGKAFGLLIEAAAGLADQCANSDELPVFCPPIASFRDAAGRADTANLACGLLLTVECDKDAQEAQKRLEGILGSATVIVASGGRWTDPDIGTISDKLHLHWRLAVPTRTPADHDLLREARHIAARLVGADITAASPVHPLRWPGSWHLKEVPRLARIIALRDAEIGLGNALTRLREAAEAEGLPVSVRGEANPQLMGDIRDIVAALAVIPNNDEEWSWWNNRILLATWGASGGSEEARKAFHEWSAKSDNKYDPTETDNRWDHVSKSPPDRIGIGTLIFEAQKADPRFRKPSDADGSDLPDPVSRFPLVRLRDNQINTAPRYLVESILPRNGLIVIWGPPKCGKSFWITDLALHVALGWDYREHRVIAGPVIYVACEGQSGVPARLEAFRKKYLDPEKDPPFFHLLTQLDLIKEVKTLIAAIKQQLGETIPILIVLDTLNRTLVGSESKDEDMAAYIGACERIKAAFNCSVAIVHHCGIDGTRPRGHTSLTGAVDGQIAIKRPDRKGPTISEVEFMKDGPEGEKTTSKLESVVVAIDDNGQEITSCIVEPCADVVAHVSKGEKMSGATQQAFMIFNELWEANGAVKKSVWRDKCTSSNRLSVNDNPKTQSKAFERAFLWLIQHDRIEINGENVSPYQGYDL